MLELAQFTKVYYICIQITNKIMSPRVALVRDFDFFFYSREEERLHVHIEKGEKSAKFWLEPSIELAHSHGFTGKELKFIKDWIEQNEQEIRDKWSTHFSDCK